MTAPLDPDEQAFLDLHAPAEPEHFDCPGYHSGLGADGGCWPATRQPAYRQWPKTITDLLLPEGHPVNDKLIRDRIPEIAASNGDYLTVRTARPGELAGLLRAKLVEETTEAIAAGPDTLLDELADVAEALHALGAHHGHSPADIEAARAAKAIQRGGFRQQLVLDLGTQNDFALCPQPDIAETTADYERLTGHAATCAAGFTDICDCPPARINPASDGADHV